MDEEGISDGASMAIYKTRGLNTWSITVKNFRMNGHNPATSTANGRELRFSFHLPFMYLPEADFIYFAEKMAAFDLNLRCRSKTGNYYCRYDRSCNDVRVSTWFFAFDIDDNAGTSNSYSLPASSNLLVPGPTVGDTDQTCYLPVFMSGRNDGVWYAGNMFLEYFYLTFDMSPYDEHGKDYIQVGVAPKNPVNNIGKFYEDTTDESGDQSQKDDNSTVIPNPPPIPTPQPDPKPDPTPSPTPDPKPSNDSTSNTNHTVDPVGPEPKPVIVDPTADPSKQEQKTWIAQNGTWVAIVSVLLVVLIAAIVYSCWKRKQDPYFAKHYSVLSEGPVKLGMTRETP